MTITLNGTTGITTPAVTNNGAYTGDGVSFADGTPSNTLVTDTSGNVGVGTSTPATKLHVSGANGVLANFQSAGGKYGVIYTDANACLFGCASSSNSAGANYLYVNATDNFQAFITNSNERMRIDSSGVIRTVTTTGFSGTAGTLATAGYNSKAGISGAFSGNVFNINWTGSAALYIDNTNLGNIQLSSDYRIKRNIQTQTAPAIERVMALRPVTYQMADYGTLFKANDDIKEGFIAHEVQEIIPSGAEGIKDAENQIQSLRVDAILAVAVKAIQELKAELDTVKTELATLKGTV